MTENGNEAIPHDSACSMNFQLTGEFRNDLIDRKDVLHEKMDFESAFVICFLVVSFFFSRFLCPG
ncbi:hypothetical membrane protein [Syntrophus aciditrophicus SB]|uniref:Hypothetical membrane protein n=1 Tax=Syntrophus aciditrophicus (strain SB) TaxID=56780 RepID=Q2LX58_SYNAS|nr:hypothetical membrane protein [Syntrophus aciditrophicus SB]